MMTSRIERLIEDVKEKEKLESELEIDLDLLPGDLLATFTDGITDSENAQEEQFGEERLTELLIGNASRPLNDIIATVIDATTRWAHDPSARDDITIVLARKL